MSKSKIVAIAFTGGVDSTICILKALEMGYDVHLIYHILWNNFNQMHLEHKSRMHLLREFSKIQAQGQGRILSCQLGTQVQFNRGQDGWYIQPLYWLTMTAPFIPKNCDEFWVSYKLKDCANSYIAELKKHWNIIKKFGRMYPFEKLNIKIEFPLLTTARQIAISEVKRLENLYQVQIFKYLTTCEDGKILKADCLCSSCKEMGEFLPEHRRNVREMMLGENLIDPPNFTEITKYIVNGLVPLTSLVSNINSPNEIVG